MSKPICSNCNRTLTSSVSKEKGVCGSCARGSYPWGEGPKIQENKQIFNLLVRKIHKLKIDEVIERFKREAILINEEIDRLKKV